MRDKEGRFIGVSDSLMDLPKEYRNLKEGYIYTQLVTKETVTLADIKKLAVGNLVINKQTRTLDCFIPDAEIVYANF